MRLIHGWCGLKTVRESHDCLSWRDVLLTSKRSKASALCCGKSKQLQNKPLFGGERHCKAVCLGPGVRGSSVCSGNCYFSLRFNDHFPGEPGLAEFIGAKDHGGGDEIRCAKLQSTRRHQQTNTQLFMPRPHRTEALSDDAPLTSDVCLSRISGLSREQRGLGRLKLAHR